MTTDNIIHSPRHLLIGMGMVIIAALGFSSKGILIKLAYALGVQVDAISVMAIRMSIALPFFLFFAIRQSHSNKQFAMTARDWTDVFLLGFIGYYLSSLLDFSGLAYISASLERMVLYLYPTIVVILTAIMGRRAMHRYEILALIMAYAGMALMFLNQQSLPNIDIWKGTSLVFAAAVSFSIFLVMGQGVIKRLGPQRFTSYTMSVAALFTLVHYFAIHDVQQFTHLPFNFYMIGIFMALFCTVLPAYMMNEGIHRIGANRAALISSAGPVMTLVLAYLVLNEILTPIQLGGMAMIIGSIYIVGKSHR